MPCVAHCGWDTSQSGKDVMSHRLPPSKTLGLGCALACSKSPTLPKKIVNPMIAILFLRILIFFSFAVKRLAPKPPRAISSDRFVHIAVSSLVAVKDWHFVIFKI